MQFGLLYPPQSTRETVVKAQLADDLGYNLFGLVDSQTLFRELYATLGPVADRTESITVGSTITNPVTRHPMVTASGMATISEFSGDRAVLGLGSGDSAVYTIGEHPARLDELEETIRTLQRLLDGDTVEYRGESLKLSWVAGGEYDPDVPVLLAAEGPKTLRLAGRVADGVIIGLGIDPDVMEHSIGLVEEGTREAGRDPDAVDLWFLAQANVADDRETAIEDIKMALAASAHHSLQFTMEGKQIPEEYREPLRELVREYDPHEHGQEGETINRQLVERLSLTDYLAERYGVVGTVEDCIDKLDSMADVRNDVGVLLTTHTEERREIISRFGREILPALR